MANEITELINRRFDLLKARIASAPTSGSTEDARQFLTTVQAAIYDFYLLLDDIDRWKPEGAQYER